MEHVLLAQRPNMRSKKKKRLGKYIDAKLKREENVRLLKNLSATKFDSSLLLSVSKLGMKTDSKRDGYSRKHSTEVASRESEQLLYRSNPRDSSNNLGNLSEEKSMPMHPQTAVTEPNAIVVEKARVVGSGLKRALEPNGQRQPTLKKRRRIFKQRATTPSLEKLPWEGFSLNLDSGSEIGGKSTAAAKMGLGNDSERE